VILGNCQAQLLEVMFAAAVPEAEVIRFPPVFEMTEAQQDDVLAAVAAADWVFSQRTSKDFHLAWLTPAALRDKWHGKVFIYPNIYFDGYFPHTQYIYRQSVGKLLSPLEDYHLAPLIAAHRRGAAIRDAAELLFMDSAEAGDPFEASFNELESREQDTDVTISDYLRAEAAERRCVYTPNHPLNYVLAELGARLAHLAGLTYSRDAAVAHTYRLNRIYIPCFPYIVRSRSLHFDLTTVFRGLEVLEVTPQEVRLGRPRSYLVEELIQAFWRIYQEFPP
jgi:hypothetical protein